MLQFFANFGIIFGLFLGLLANSYQLCLAQKIIWSEKYPNTYYSLQGDSLLLKINILTKDSSVVLNRDNLKLNQKDKPKLARAYFFDAEQKILLFYNATRVWRYKTKGDFLIYDLKTGKHRILGHGLAKKSLSATELSPNGKWVAYSSSNNVYVEDLTRNSNPIQVTKDGRGNLFNGIFDWSYEEEFNARGGIRWSANSDFLAFWQIDAKQIPDFFMLNNTDSSYPTLVHMPYPKVGYHIAKAKIFYYNLASKSKRLITIPNYNPSENFITQLSSYPKGNKFLIQTLNRKQQLTRIYSFDCTNGTNKLLYQEENKAWLETMNFNDRFHSKNLAQSWWWINQDGDFLILNEEGKFRNLVHVKQNGKRNFITPDEYDIISVEHLDTVNKIVYFIASPENATERYLYQVNYNQPNAKAQKLTPNIFQGTNSYNIHPKFKLAYHIFSSYKVPPLYEFVSLPKHKPLNLTETYVKNYIDSNLKVQANNGISFFQLKTEDNIILDGYMCKPINFDSNRKYPVLFYVYGEPASQTTLNSFANTHRSDRAYCPALLIGEQNFLYVVLDNRGSPAPKGTSWRKAIYQKLGTVNVRDQFLGAKSFLNSYSFVDTSRVGVWGWSGGGSVTLHLLFKHPEIYKMGISIAPLTDLSTYDNIYEERYMGLISDPDGLERYKKASPISYVDSLRGQLLLIHGTGDDNVHYQNSELLINALIKANKVFSFMSYPNRSHSISEGVGTSPHLRKTFTNFVQQFLLKKQI